MTFSYHCRMVGLYCTNDWKKDIIWVLGDESSSQMDISIRHLVNCMDNYSCMEVAKQFRQTQVYVNYHTLSKINKIIKFSRLFFRRGQEVGLIPIIFSGFCLFVNILLDITQGKSNSKLRSLSQIYVIYNRNVISKSQQI